MLRLKHLLQRGRYERKTLGSISQCSKSDVSNKIQRSKSNTNVSHLTGTELEYAEMEFIKCCPRQRFKGEITALQKGEKLKRSHAVKLDPVMDDGVLRGGGICISIRSQTSCHSSSKPPCVYFDSQTHS